MAMITQFAAIDQLWLPQLPVECAKTAPPFFYAVLFLALLVSISSVMVPPIYTANC